MVRIEITSLSFIEPKNFPAMADVYYSLVGFSSVLNGCIRIPVPRDFIEKITTDVKEIIESQVKELE